MFQAVEKQEAVTLSLTGVDVLSPFLGLIHNLSRPRKLYHFQRKKYSSTQNSETILDGKNQY